MTFFQVPRTTSFVVNENFEVTKVHCPGSFEIWKNNPNGPPVHHAELRVGDDIVSFEACDMKRIGQLDKLLTDRAPYEGFYELIVNRPNRAGSRRCERLHLKLKKVAEFEPGAEWGAAVSVTCPIDEVSASDAQRSKLRRTVQVGV